ncbi:MAG: stage 0 sporulation protein [Clostridia bacterium]|nr:stage 0 sporulation protein [Clostridia bacterium]
MTEVIGVRFKKVGKVYYFDPHGISVEKDMPVVVETSRGMEYGEVAMANAQVEDEKIIQPLKRMIRIATDADKKIAEENARFEQDAFHICEEKIAKHQLDMKLVTVEYTFDHSKLLFYFSADGRVDFRELVKDLASVFRTRIELRQIGVRDEAKMIGGLGICGRPLCCGAFLKDFQPVSINMAKDQGLSLNPTKISGTCGRLMCCLKYESEAYQDMIRQTPPADSLVDTPYGRGTVMDSSLLRGTCRVRMQNNPDSPMTLSCEECRILRRGRDKGDPLPELPPSPAFEQSKPLRETLEPLDAPDAERTQAPRRDRSSRPQNRHPKRDNAPADPAGDRQNAARSGGKGSFKKRAPRSEQSRSGKEHAGEAASSEKQGQNRKRRYRGDKRCGAKREGGKPAQSSSAE